MSFPLATVELAFRYGFDAGRDSLGHIPNVSEAWERDKVYLELEEHARLVAAVQPPAKLQIGFLTFGLKFVDEDVAEESKLWGWCDKGRQLIYLRRGMTPQRMAQVAWHEVLHALFEVAGFEDDQSFDQETVCSRLDGPLTAFFIDNPEFFAWLSYLRTLKI